MQVIETFQWKIKENISRQMDELIRRLDGAKERPKLLLHSCCGPCSSYVLTYLAPWFDVTVLFYNPNIEPEEEYLHRKSEQIRLIGILREQGLSIGWRDIDYDHASFEEAAKGFETEPEGGARCARCFRLRLFKTAQIANEEGSDAFATTLTVSPHKNAPLINQIGKKIEEELGVRYLPSDFKKKNGYLTSTRLAAEYDLYRQSYCGCHYGQIMVN